MWEHTRTAMDACRQASLSGLALLLWLRPLGSHLVHLIDKVHPLLSTPIILYLHLGGIRGFFTCATHKKSHAENERHEQEPRPSEHVAYPFS